MLEEVQPLIEDLPYQQHAASRVSNMWSMSSVLDCIMAAIIIGCVIATVILLV